MDESGDAGLPDADSSPTEYMAYVGVVVTPEQNFQIQNRIRGVIDSHFQHKSFDPPEELKYNDIVRERGPFGRISGQERKDICDDIFHLINEVEPMLMGTIIDKVTLEDRYHDPISPKLYAFRSNVERFQYLLDDNTEYGSIVIDESEQYRDNQLRQIVYRAPEDGIKLVGKDVDIPNIMDSAMTTPSEMSPGVQLADFVAYVSRCHFERGQSDRYEEIEHLWRDPPGTTFSEPSLLPG